MISVGFTRPPERIAEAEQEIRKRGMQPYGAPSLVSVRGRDSVFEEIEETLSSGEAYFTVFASITAVECVVEEYGKEKVLALLSETNVACTGPSTEAAMQRLLGRGCDLVPEVYSGVGIATEIADEVCDKTVLILRSAEGDGGIVTILEEAGAVVLDEAVYAMEPAPFSPAHSALLDALGDGEIDVMLFTSPKSFTILLEQAEKWLGARKAHSSLESVCKMAIGLPTSKAMEKYGLEPQILPEKSTFAGMLDAVEENASLFRRA